MNDLDFGWIAGWLEGEGTFYFAQQRMAAVMQVFSIDRDTIDKAHALIGGGIYLVKPRNRSQGGWRLQLEGAPAVSLMTKLYPVMGERRKEQIGKAVEAWETRSNRPVEKVCACGCGRVFVARPEQIHAIQGACGQRAYRNRQKALA